MYPYEALLLRSTDSLRVCSIFPPPRYLALQVAVLFDNAVKQRGCVSTHLVSSCTLLLLTCEVYTFNPPPSPSLALSLPACLNGSRRHCLQELPALALQS